MPARTSTERHNSVTGRIVYTPAPPVPPHGCDLPLDSEFAAYPIIPGTDPQQYAEVGTVWECDTCHRIWVVEYHRGYDSRSWSPESRWARWRRERRAK